MKTFRMNTNEKNIGDLRDENLRVDMEEVVLTRYNSASNKQQK